jgi:type I restriction enzyme S subunit
MTFDKSNWKAVTFGEVCRNVNDNERDPLGAGIERYVGLEHIEPENLHIRSWGNVADGTTFTKVFRPGHVLFGKRRAYQKKAALADFTGLCSGDILVLEPNPAVIDPHFFPFLVQSDRFFDFAVQTSAGSLSPRTKFQDLAQFQFLLPPKDQQARLAELLWAGDAVVEGYGRLLDKLNKSRVSYMRSSYGSFSSTRMIREIAKITSGGTPDRKVSTFWNGDIPWIKTTEIDYKNIYESEEFISEEGLRNSAAKIIPKESLLMAMYGQGVTRGRVARLKIDATVNQACAAIILNEKRDLDYIYYYLQFSYEAIRELAQGANQQNLNGEIIKNIEVPYPDIESRVQIGKKLKKLDEQSGKVEMTVNRTKEIISTLLHQIFTS